MGTTSFTDDDWLAKVVEPIVDADQPIVDPHHHLWHRPEIGDYTLDDLLADTGSGHRVEATVFVECRAAYRTDGPEHLRPVGETEFVAANAAASEQRAGATIAGIVAHADLRLSPDRLGEVLDAHEVAGGGRFRGIRHALARAPEPEAMRIPGRAPEGLYRDDAFRAGLVELGRRGLTWDTWHYHPQIPEMTELARAVPDTTMVLDHFGTPIGVGSFAGRLDDIFPVWCDDLAELAECPNVVAKLGGLAMPDNGYGFHERDRPPTSAELVDAHQRWYDHVIECFGAQRCMLESNFPVDKLSVSYHVLWNALKTMIADRPPTERDALCQGTARRIYRLDHPTS